MTVHPIALLLVGPLAVLLLVFKIFRSYRSSYLEQWTLSFTALVLFRAGVVAVAMRTSATGSSAGAAQIVISIFAGAAAYLQIAWMLWGCFDLSTRKPLRIADSHRLLAILATAGVISGTLPFLIGRDAAVHQYLPFALHSLALAVTFFLSAVAVRRFRGRGFTVAAVAFGVYGLAQLEAFVLVMRALIAHSAQPPLFAAGVVDLIGSAVVAVGCAMVVLEDQREAGAEATSQVEQLAYYDPLTGLPNRALFADRLRVALAHAHRHRYKLAVLFLDVDRFKQINDSLGHTVGDRLLKVVAERIRAAIRDEDTVARFGGDEFTVLIHIIGKVEDSAKIAQKILDSMKAAIRIDDRDFVVTCSIGISIYAADGVDGETLIRNADTAMYRAKDLGRNSYQFYAATMNHKALAALEVENGMRRALAQNEFILYYQPLVDISTGSVFGIEALIRWQHPEHGLLRPDRFVPAAEESGLIITIGRWVLREACMQAAEWHRRGHRVIMAVNLSGRQFQDPELIAQVREALEAAGLRPQYLELEITEGYAMQDVQKAIEILRQLKKLGVRIAIDDFGTGYSCLSYLKQFPIDTLKLDSSFVRDIAAPEDAQIALGVIALAHSLKLKVIAEGVETIGQLTFLRENACDRLQGYLFSRPMPPASFDTFMNQKDVLRLARSH